MKRTVHYFFSLSLNHFQVDSIISLNITCISIDYSITSFLKRSICSFCFSRRTAVYRRIAAYGFIHDGILVVTKCQSVSYGSLMIIAWFCLSTYTARVGFKIYPRRRYSNQSRHLRCLQLLYYIRISLWIWCTYIICNEAITIIFYPWNPCALQE